MTLKDKLAEEYADRESGLYPGEGSLGEPYWHRTWVSSKRGFLAGFIEARYKCYLHVAIRSNESDIICPEITNIGENEL